MDLRRLSALAALAVCSFALHGCGGSDESTTTTTSMSTSTSSSRTTSSTPAPPPAPDLPMTESGLTKVCGDVVSQCQADTVCESAWTGAANCDHCECIAKSLSDAAVLGPTEALEALAGCLKQACVPGTSTTTTTTTTSTTPAGTGIDRQKLETTCPTVVESCKDDASSCASAWECFGNSQQDCTSFGDCLSEAAKVSVSSALEEMAGCLDQACTGKTRTTTTTTTTPSTAPAISQKGLEATCPSYVTDCKSDSSCNSAWQCMSVALEDCGSYAQCISDAATISMTEPLQAMASCMDAICSASLTV